MGSWTAKEVFKHSDYKKTKKLKTQPAIEEEVLLPRPFLFGKEETQLLGELPNPSQTTLGLAFAPTSL